ncbi:hypothetical protein C8Q78DRAFT_231882 [Trametes maxima]|nr:hypothetical protein C8Q78DRAFT_231882 [Trametes maxima]
MKVTPRSTVLRIPMLAWPAVATCMHKPNHTGSLHGYGLGSVACVDAHVREVGSGVHRARPSPPEPARSHRSGQGDTWYTHEMVFYTLTTPQAHSVTRGAPKTALN